MRDIRIVRVTEEQLQRILHAVHDAPISYVIEYLPQGFYVARWIPNVARVHRSNLKLRKLFDLQAVRYVNHLRIFLHSRVPKIPTSNSIGEISGNCIVIRHVLEHM